MCKCNNLNKSHVQKAQKKSVLCHIIFLKSSDKEKILKKRE